MWKTVVHATRSPLLMGMFIVGVGAASVGAGETAIKTTSKGDAALEETLRGKETIESRMLARANKERLGVLFEEIKRGEGGRRYAAALNGESLGCHSTGTTKAGHYRPINLEKEESSPSSSSSS